MILFVPLVIGFPAYAPIEIFPDPVALGKVWEFPILMLPSVNPNTPLICSFVCGFVVPIPTPVCVILAFSFSANIPPAKNERYLLVDAAPIDKLPSEVYKYPSSAPLTVQEPEEKALLLIPKSI